MVAALEEHEGVEALESFEYHSNKQLSDMAVGLVEKYFYKDDVCAP
jgi:hypothetical protein